MNYLRSAVSGQITLWRDLFPRAWDSLRLVDKFVFLVFLGQTIAVITLAEALLLR